MRIRAVYAFFWKLSDMRGNQLITLHKTWQVERICNQSFGKEMQSDNIATKKGEMHHPPLSVSELSLEIISLFSKFFWGSLHPTSVTSYSPISLLILHFQSWPFLPSPYGLSQLGVALILVLIPSGMLPEPLSHFLSFSLTLNSSYFLSLRAEVFCDPVH